MNLGKVSRQKQQYIYRYTNILFWELNSILKNKNNRQGTGDYGRPCKRAGSKSIYIQ